MRSGTVAIVGRPNVGKSTLFNRLIGARQAITLNMPRTTRDRIYSGFELKNVEHTLIDTGGLELLKKDDPIAKLIEIQVNLAVDEADLILFIVDGREGLNPLDQYVADFLRRKKKPVFLFVNKIDDYNSAPAMINEFFRLGFSGPYWLSAQHGLNLDPMLEKIQTTLEELGEKEEEELPEGTMKLAIVGQPNVGKSSLMNKFLKTDRVMVDNKPGTTRDPIEAAFAIGDRNFILVDTAGIRRVNQLKNDVDKISVIYSEKVIQQADICLLVLDATRELSQQDKRIAGMIVEYQKPCILLVNKWDLVGNKEEAATKLDEQFDEELYFLKFCPRAYISALSGQRLSKLQDMIVELVEKLHLRVNTNHLNNLIQEAVTIHHPPSYKGKVLKIYYVSQMRNQSGTFIFKVNDANLVHFSYYRYLENTIRSFYKFEGIPLKLIFKGKEKTKNES